jgi:Protein of unknown function, DUF547
MKNLFLILFSWFSISCAQQVDHSVFTDIMKEYNVNGDLNYKGLTTEKRLDLYLDDLSNTNISNLETDDSKMAFWINVYNAFTIKAIVDNYPVESINDLHTGGRIIGHILSTTVWDDEFINISGKEYSLNHIEHKILRKKYNEPRIHFSIVCASISCPQLRDEAFVENRLKFQMEQQAIQFFNDESKNKVDLENRTVHLSKILDWFSEDFGDSDREILLFVSKYLNSNISDDIKENLDK